MTTADAITRLLRIQSLLEQHDSHTEDCECAFCEATDEVALLRSDLRTSELREQRGRAAA